MSLWRVLALARSPDVYPGKQTHMGTIAYRAGRFYRLEWSPDALVDARTELDRKRIEKFSRNGPRHAYSVTMYPLYVSADMEFLYIDGEVTQLNLREYDRATGKRRTDSRATGTSQAAQAEASAGRVGR